MAKHTETVMIYDPGTRTERAVTLEISGPELVLEALDHGCLNNEILANAVAGVVGRHCVLEVKVIQKDREGKPKRR